MQNKTICNNSVEANISRIKQNLEKNHRTILTIGEDYVNDILEKTIEVFNGILKFDRIFSFSDDLKINIQRSDEYKVIHINSKTAQGFLGSSTKFIVIKDLSIINPSILCMILEMVSGTGIILLCLPNVEYNNIYNSRMIKIITEDAASICLTSELLTNLEQEKTSFVGILLKHSRSSKYYSEDQKRCIEISSDLLANHSIDDKTKVVSILAPRGRGKTFSLGLIIVEAINLGYMRIKLTSKHLQPLTSLMEYLYNILQKTFDSIKINWRKKNRIKYINSIIINKRQEIYLSEIKTASNTTPDITFIDEAATIPISQLKTNFNSSVVFLATTTDGYEGTGRNFTKKLEFYLNSSNEINYQKILMNTPIRYGENDPVENILLNTFFLYSENCSIDVIKEPEECFLCHVNKNQLFAGNKESEDLLSKISILFALSHYKNSPDDFKNLAMFDHHELFVLSDDKYNIYCAIQIAFEGISSSKCTKDGNLIPWSVSENSRNKYFNNTPGIRIIRIATPSDIQGRGFGSYGIQELIKHSSMWHMNDLLENNRLVNPIASYRNRQVFWIGASFGLTYQLARFWRRNGFKPIYIHYIKNDETDCFNTIFIKGFDSSSNSNIDVISDNMVQRFIALCSINFRDMPSSEIYEIIFSSSFISDNKENILQFSELEKQDILHFYRQEISIKKILYVIPKIANYYFCSKIPDISILSTIILIKFGLQRLSIQEISNILNLPIELIYKLIGFNVSYIVRTTEMINKF